MGSQITVTLRLLSEHLFSWWRRAEDLKPDCLNAHTAATNQWWGYWVVFLISLNTSSFPFSAEVTVKRSACLLQQVSRNVCRTLREAWLSSGLLRQGPATRAPRSQGAFRLVASHIHLRSVQGLSEINPPRVPGVWGVQSSLPVSEW